MNDLVIRDHLREAMASASAENAAGVADALAEADDRFERATDSCADAIPFSPVTPGWWWFRVPKILLEDLGRDLRAHRHVD